MIWVAGRSPTLVSHSLRGVATNLKATTLAYLAILLIHSSCFPSWFLSVAAVPLNRLQCLDGKKVASFPRTTTEHDNRFNF
jgi:hypothetical protein